MPTGCEASGTIVKGDAVCVTGWNAGQAVVKRATRTNLAQSKTVYGVAQDDTDPLTGIVQVLVAGEVADDSITNLTASAGWTGTSRIVATDINQAAAADQCKLAVVDRPDGSEHVVGTCDENGNLSCQPRASRDTSSMHVYNLRAYGGVPDGRIITDGVTANASTTFTSASAAFTNDDETRNIQIAGAGAAGGVLDTTIVSVTNATTAVLAAAAQADLTRARAMIWKTDNEAALTAAAAAIPDSGGILLFPWGPGIYVVATDKTLPSNIQVSFDEGAIVATAVDKTLTIEGRVACHTTQHVFDGFGDFAFATGALPNFNVRNFGAKGDAETDDMVAFRRTITSMTSLTPTNAGGTLYVPLGTYVLVGTLGDALSKIPVNATIRGDSAGQEVGDNPGSVLECRNSLGDGLIAFDGGDGAASAFVVVQDIAIKDGTVATPRGPAWTASTPMPLGQAILPTVFNGLYYIWQGPMWQSNKTPAVGDVVLPTSPNDFYYECTRAAGGAVVTGPKEPVWPVADGLTIFDPPDQPINGVEWTCREGLAGYTAPTGNAEPNWGAFGPTEVVPDTAGGGAIFWTPHELPPLGPLECVYHDDAGTWEPELGQVVLPTTPNGHYYVCIKADGPVANAAEPAWPTGQGEPIDDGADVTWKEAGLTLAPVWRPGWEVAQGQTVVPTHANGFYYTRTNAGANTTDPLEPEWPTEVGITVNDNGITWECTAPTRAGLRTIFGAHIRVERVRFAGWQYAIQIEGTEDVDVSHVRFAADGGDVGKGAQFPCSASVGIILAVGENEAVDSTATIAVHNNTFNGHETSVVSNGGHSHSIFSNTCQFSDCGQFAVIHGSTVSTWENNLGSDRQGATRAMFRITGAPRLVAIRSNQIVVGDRAGVIVDGTVAGLSIVDNDFGCGTRGVRGVLKMAGPVVLTGNVFQLAPFFDDATCAGTILTLNNEEEGLETTTKVGINTALPSASLDILHGSGSPDSGGFPAIRMGNPSYTFLEHAVHSLDAPHKQSVRYRAPATPTNQDPGAITLLETADLITAGGGNTDAKDVCSVDIPAGFVALASWRVVAKRTSGVVDDGVAAWKRTALVDNRAGMAFGAITDEAPPVDLQAGADPPATAPVLVNPAGDTLAVRISDTTAQNDDASTWETELQVVLI